MMNGEGTREATTSEVAPPDPQDELLLLPWQSPKSDGGDESPVYSQYSSCGDSEFERYCSANSVMGTPSLCSSIGTFQDCGDSEFGSVKSFGLADVGSLENFQLGGGFRRNSGEEKPLSSSRSGCLSDRRIEPCEGKSSVELRNDVVGKHLMAVNDGLNSCSSMDSSLWHVSNGANTGNMVSSMVESDSELPVVMDLQTVLDEELYVGDDGRGVVRWRDSSESAFMQSPGGTVSAQQTTDIEAIEENILSSGVNSYTHSSAMAEGEDHPHINVELVNSCLDDLFSHSDPEFGKREGGGCSDEDKASSRFEHSEGEDSMFGDGTDDEQKMDYLHHRNMQYHQEANVNKEKSLLMSSSLAFGADDWDDFEQETRESNINSIIVEKEESNIETERKPLSSPFQTNIGFPGVGSEQGEIVMDITVDSNQVQGADELAGCTGNASLTPVDSLNFCETERGKDAVDVFVTNNQAGDLDELDDYLKNCSGSDILPREQDQPSQEAPLEKGSSFTDTNLRNCRPPLSTQEFDNVDGSQVSESQEPDISTLQLDPLCDVTDGQPGSASNETPEDQSVSHLKEECSSQPTDQNNIKKSQKDSPALFDRFEDRTKEVKTENLELNEFYNEVVHEMEEILLDSTESSGARFTQGERANQSHLHLPLRDGGSNASTSGNDDAYPFIQHPLRIDGVEVAGAKQKKGGVSFGERLVGVKEYTVYIIRVWSGKDHWEVERRYRDFCTLYRQLKTLFTGQGWVLPSPWSSVERESRKIFGNVSPDVVAERSALIQECLRSILHCRFPSSLPSTLMLFLSPPKDIPSSPASNAGDSESPFSARSMGSKLTFGKTISLIVEIQPYKSVKQILEAQHHICAGCHRNFDDGKTRMLEFAQTLGWGKPRLCEYTGQLFCSSCHTNETAVLPARVLHHWDFTQYPVSQLAKSYLESIHDKPMLCVSAVNPFLFSKVPALRLVMSVRKRIEAMLPYVHCPFRMSIYKGLGSRRYLLESNDFFALRDLIDLSKGAFAALPVMVETVSKKILEHITEQCLVCCDVGVPCNARQACHDPSSLIFPFQEGEIERCKSCKSVFHKSCFRKIPSCPCGEALKQDKGGSTNASHKFGKELSRSTLDLFSRKSDSNSTMGFISGLFTKARPEKLLGPKDRDNIILMGSLPSTSV